MSLSGTRAGRAPPAAGPGPTGEALSLAVEGVVQGVGFRPFIARLAREHRLAGRVRNRSGDVVLHVEGDREEIRAFRARLGGPLPPLARIERITFAPAAPEGLSSFVIAPSTGGSGLRQPIAPDAAMCEACEAELLDPANRRYGYPFITCTDCGPRFTVIDAMPYDREGTTMRAFRMCEACLEEYRAPGDRRCHSQTNSCPRCGPRLAFAPLGGPGPDDGDPLDRAAALLLGGGILGVRGLGGFHLAVDATDPAAVDRLRRRKRREAKPFAVMVRSVGELRHFARPTAAEARLLSGTERPIVLLRTRSVGGLATSIAPELDRIGFMLAYTPLHRLLLDRVDRPLVMTSGNATDEPIATGNEEARVRLEGIADALLLHDREIVARYDDSVLRLAGARPVFLRRSRGYAPLPLPLPIPTPVPFLAVGPHLKNTFTLAQGRMAWMSAHIGELESLETLQHFRESLERFRHLFGIAPERVVRDLHPGYLSTRLAEAFEATLGPALTVQHHHAHIAAILAEHGRIGPVVGLAFDGVGYGDDGTVWGGEILVADLTTARRAGHLRPAPLPGGDLASRTPWRAALGYGILGEADRADSHGWAVAWPRAFASISPATLRGVAQQARRGVNAPPSSSMGRLFDAAAAVLGVKQNSVYEGQAAMELESLAGDRPAAALPFPIERETGNLVLDPLPLLDALARGVEEGRAPAELAAAFHESVACTAIEAAARVSAAEGLDTVALGGGVFQNARLLVRIREGLEARGLQVLQAERLPPNDGAVSYGQAAVAAARLAAAIEG